MGETLRAGIIGCGQMGRLHAGVLSTLPDVEVAAVCSRSPALVEAVAADYGAQPFTDYQELLKEPPDLVYVCTPEDTHREIGVAALEAGCHLFMEKALAATLADARRLASAAAARPDQISMVGYILQFHPYYRLMREALARDDAGKPVMGWSLRTHFLSETQPVYDKYRDDWYRPPSWYFQKERGRGPVFSHASHDYDLFRTFIGEVAEVQTVGGRFLVQEGDIADAFSVTLQFESGAFATVSAPWVTRVEYDFVGVATTELTVVNNNNQLRLKRRGRQEERTQVAANDMWQVMHRHFLDAVQQGAEPLVTVEDGLKAVEIGEAAFLALESGGTVSMADVRSA